MRTSPDPYRLILDLGGESNDLEGDWYRQGEPWNPPPRPTLPAVPSYVQPDRLHDADSIFQQMFDANLHPGEPIFPRERQGLMELLLQWIREQRPSPPYLSHPYETF